MLPLVSIIIPTFNTEKHIKDAIESALCQSWSNKEIIIVDDGSTDKTLQIAISYQSKETKIVSQPNRGACAARNTGFLISKGEYIQWLDGDDYLENTKIEDQMKVALNDKDAVIYGPWLNRIENGKTLQFGPRNLTQAVNNPLSIHLEGLLAPTIAFLTPRLVLQEVGGWDESLVADQDGDLFMRLMLQGKRFVHAPGGAAVWRHHQNPCRVSTSRSLAAFHSRYLVCLRMINQLQHQNNLCHYAQNLAWRLDRLAQLSVIEYPYFAEQCLQTATEICPNYQPQGSLIYKLLRSFLGFKFSENVRSRHRKLKNYLMPKYQETSKWLIAERTQII